MENRLLKLTIAATVGIILVAALLMPVINDAKVTAGDTVSYSQAGAQVGNADLKFYEITDDTDITYVTASDDTISINGTSYTYSTTATWGSVIYTDVGYMGVRISTGSVQYYIYDKEANTSIAIDTLSAPATVTLSGHTLSFNGVEYVCTYGYYMDAIINHDSEDTYFNAVSLTQRTGTYYVNSISDVHCFGMYTTGENDCWYSMVNGIVTTNGDFTTAVNDTLTLVDGTTDIYQITNFSIGIGEETFTPYFAFLPATIYGHADSGANYSLYGVVPVLVLTAILISFVAIVARRND